MASSDIAADRPTRVRWLVFVLACGTSWFLYLHRYTWNIIRPELAKEYKFSNTELEALYACFYTSYSIGQIPSGIVSDLFGTHVFLSVIIVVWSVALLLFGLVRGAVLFGGLRFIFGAAQAGTYPALGQVTRTWFPGSSRTIVQGWVASFFGRCGGAMASIIMATFLMSICGLNWQTALLILAGFGLVFAAAFYSLYRDTPEVDPRVNQAERDLIREGEAPVPVSVEKGAAPAPSSRRMLSFQDAARNPTMQVLIGQQFLNAGADAPYTAILGSYFLALGASELQYGWLISIPLVGGALGGMVGGYCNDYLIRRTGDRRKSRTAVGFTGKLLAAVLLVAATTQGSLMTVAALLFLVKFFSDWSQPTVWGTCTDIGGRSSATVFSIINTSGNVGALFVPLIYGPLLDYYRTWEIVDGKEVQVTHFAPMWLLIAGMYVVCACAWFAVDCTRPVEAPAEA